METCDTYCLLPEGAKLAEALNQLFSFEGVVYHDGVTDHPIRAGRDASTAFFRLMKDGDFIRFHSSTIDRTEGGWLYRLADGSPVIGLSGDASASAATFERALEEAIPGCRCCSPGDQPPPMTRAEFMRTIETERDDPPPASSTSTA